MNTPVIWDNLITVVIFSDNNYTSATVLEVGIPVANGFARRMPGDAPDGYLGTDLAVARALDKYSRKLAKRAAGRMKMAEGRIRSKERLRSRLEVVFTTWVDLQNSHPVQAALVTPENLGAALAINEKATVGCYLIQRLIDDKVYNSWSEAEYFLRLFHPAAES